MRRSIPPWRGKGFSVDEAFDQMIMFASTFGAAAANLAAYCSVLEQLTVESVGLMRQNFLRSEDRWRASLDADLLHGGLCYETNSGFFRMDTEVRRQFLYSLDIWAIRKGYDGPPSQSAARFVRHFVRRARQSDARVSLKWFNQYLNSLEWVAIGFDEPELAARQLARTVRDAVDHGPTEGWPRIRLSFLSGLLSLPLVEHDDLLALVDGLDAAGSGDMVRARRLLGSAEATPMQVLDIELPSNLELLARFDRLEGKDRPLGRTPEMGRSLSVNPAKDTGALNPVAPAALSRPDNLSAHQAVLEGDTSHLETLLSNDPGCHLFRDATGLNAVHLAAKVGQIECLEVLLDHDPSAMLLAAENYTPLLQAVANGQLEAVLLLLKAGANIEDRTVENGVSAIGVAANYGHHEVIRLLVDHGANIDAVSRSGSTAAHFALYCGRSATFDLLLSLGFDLEGAVSRPNQDFTLMHSAAAGGCSTAILRILQAAPDVDRKSEKGGWTPLHLAAYFGRTRMVSTLIELGADLHARTDEGWTALHTAAQDFGETVRALCVFTDEPDVRLARNSHTPLNIAVHHNCPAAITALLGAGADPNLPIFEDPPLLTAFEKGFNESVSAILSCSRTDPNLSNRAGKTALSIAFASEDDSLLFLLLADERVDRNQRAEVDRGSDSHPFLKSLHRRAIFDLLVVDPKVKLEEEEWTTLVRKYVSSKEEDAEYILSRLLEREDVRHQVLRDASRHIALILEACDVERVDRLLAIGVDPASRNRLGQSIGHLAVLKGSAESLKHLVRKVPQIHVDDRDVVGMTPLLSACQLGVALALIEDLLSIGADATAVNVDGWNGLHLAAQAGNVEICERLLGLGLDPEEATTDRMLSPLQIAAESGSQAVCHLLLERGVKVTDNESDQHPMILAAIYGHTDVVNLFGKRLAHGVVGESATDVSGLTLRVLSHMRERIARLSLAGGTVDVSEARTAELLERLVSGEVILPSAFVPEGDDESKGSAEKPS